MSVSKALDVNLPQMVMAEEEAPDGVEESSSEIPAFAAT